MRRVWVAVLVMLLPGCVTKSVRTSEQTATIEFPEAEWDPVAVSLLESTENGAAFRRGPRFVAGPPATGPAPSNPATSTGATSPPITAATPKPAPPSVSPPAVPPPTGSRSELGAEYVKEGESVKFAASADGTPPLTYQWRKDGQPIPGQTNAFLAFLRVRPADAGEYDCLVTNAAGQKASEPFKLVVRKR